MEDLQNIINPLKSQYKSIINKLPVCALHERYLKNWSFKSLTRVKQHGFKCGRSTATLSIDLQSIIARALNKNDYVLVSTLDLSAGFDTVNIDKN
jgi:hypothetical protein